MLQKSYKIEGMSCQHCVKALEVEIRELNLESFQVDIGSLVVNFKDSTDLETEINEAVNEAGFKVIQ